MVENYLFVVCLKFKLRISEMSTVSYELLTQISFLSDLYQITVHDMALVYNVEHVCRL